MQILPLTIFVKPYIPCSETIPSSRVWYTLLYINMNMFCSLMYIINETYILKPKLFQTMIYRQIQ
jgi:hypothetical protein